MDISGFYQATVADLAASLTVFSDCQDIVLRIVSGLADIEDGDMWVYTSPTAEMCHTAVKKGCRAIVCEQNPGFDQVPMIVVEAIEPALGLLANTLYQEPSSHMSVIAVTGTNGKTTVAYLCAKALQYLQRESVYIGTLGSGHPDHLSPQKRTTPACGEIHYKLALARDQGVEAVAMEASSHGLHQGRLSGVMIDVAVFTNLTHEHMDYHKTINAYLAAKEKLMTMASVSLTVINQDDPSGQILIDRIKKPVWPVSFTAIPRGFKRWSYGAVESITIEGMHIKILTHQQSVWIDTPLIGSFNAENLVMAHAALCLTGIDPKKAAEGLSSVKEIPGRMQRIQGNSYTAHVFVDYSHTPSALERVLAQLREMVKGRLWVVFGCGGDRDKDKRPMMGRIAERYADEVVITEDNSRTEQFSTIANEILSGMKTATFAQVIASRKEAIKYVLRESSQHDIVLIAGKGHETTIENQDGVSHFSDIEVARKAILA